MEHDCCISQRAKELEDRIRRLALNRRQKVYGNSLTKQKKGVSLPATTKAKLVRLAGERRKRFYFRCCAMIEWQTLV